MDRTDAVPCAGSFSGGMAQGKLERNCREEAETEPQGDSFAPRERAKLVIVAG